MDSIKNAFDGEIEDTKEESTTTTKDGEWRRKKNKEDKKIIYEIKHNNILITFFISLFVELHKWIRNESLNTIKYLKQSIFLLNCLNLSLEILSNSVIEFNLST